MTEIANQMIDVVYSSAEQMIFREKCQLILHSLEQFEKKIFKNTKSGLNKENSYILQKNESSFSLYSNQTCRAVNDKISNQNQKINKKKISFLNSQRRNSLIDKLSSLKMHKPKNFEEKKFELNAAFSQKDSIIESIETDKSINDSESVDSFDKNTLRTKIYL